MMMFWAFFWICLKLALFMGCVLLVKFIIVRFRKN